jgi:hypothetical protein
LAQAICHNVEMLSIPAFSIDLPRCVPYRPAEVAVCRPGAGAPAPRCDKKKSLHLGTQALGRGYQPGDGGSDWDCQPGEPHRPWIILCLVAQSVNPSTPLRWSGGCGIFVLGEIAIMYVAWPQKTVKGLGPSGNPESADPHTESDERRARVRSA